MAGEVIRKKGPKAVIECKQDIPCNPCTTCCAFKAITFAGSISSLPELDEESQKLVDILRFEEKSFDELAIDMKMNSSSLNSLLTILEMQGIIRQSAGKMYRALV